MTEGTICVVCEMPREATQLHRCRSCRRMYCSDCAFSSRMGKFCSRECGDIYYHGETDDEPSEGTDEHDD